MPVATDRALVHACPNLIMNRHAAAGMHCGTMRAMEISAPVSTTPLTPEV